MPNDRDRVIIEDGEVSDTVELMKKVVWKYLKDTKQIAPTLKGSSIEQTCKNIWNFLYHHIQYKLDKHGLEQLRRPARSWQECQTGIDCDCFSIFISSILTNLQIPHSFRITKYDKGVFQHVYVVVPTSNGMHIIDPVLSKANYEKPYTAKKDFSMSIDGINIAVLDGVDDENDFIEEIINGGFDGLGSLDKADPNLTYDYLLKTRAYLIKNPASVVAFEDPQAFLEMLDYAIKYWHTSQRDKAIQILIQNEDSLNIRNGFNPDGISGLNDPDYEDVLDNDWSELDGMSNEEIVEYLDALEETQDFIEEELDAVDGLGDLGRGGKARRKARRTARKTKRTTWKAKNKKLKAEKKAIKKKYGKGKAKRKAMREWKKKNKRGFFRAVGRGIKASLVKFNPLVAAARNGFLLAMKLNLFKMAERIKWGYATPEQAKGKVSDNRYQKAKNGVTKIEKLYVDKLMGNREKLRNCILKGKSGGLNGVPDNYFNEQMNGLSEPISAATLAAAAAVITATAGILKSVGLGDKDDPSEGDLKKDLENYDIPQEELENFEPDYAEGESGGSGSKGKLGTFLKNNPMVAVGGVAAIGGIGYMLFKPKKKPNQKSLSGTSQKKSSSSKAAKSNKVETIKLS